MNNSKTLTVRCTIQIILNFVFYIILMRYVSISNASLLFLTTLPQIIMYITVFQVLTSIVLESVVLGFLNTFLIFQTVLHRSPYFIKLDIFIVLMITSFISILVFKVFSLRDALIDAIKNARLFSRRSIDYKRIFRNYALFFAIISIILPIIVLTYSYFLLFVFNIDYNTLRGLILIYLSLNILVSLPILVSINKPLVILKTSLYTTVSLWSFTPLLAHLVNVSTTLYVGKSIENLKPSEPEKGMLLGSVKARLVYDVPRKLFQGFEQQWIRNTRRKTWFWQEHDDILTIDPGKLQNKHIVIMGSSGSGKSLLAKNIILEYYTKYGTKFIVFDPHNEYYILKKYVSDVEIIDASTLSLNPLEIGRSNPRERAHQLSSIIMSIFRLGHLQRQTIEELILKTYEYFGIFQDHPSTWSSKPPTLREVLETCKKALSEPETREIYSRVYPYLKILVDNVFEGTSLLFSKVLDKPSIIVLSNLKSDYIRLLYVDTFLHRLINMLYRRELRGEYLVVLDEAYTLFTRDYSKHVISRLLIESRKYGIGVIYITQYPILTPQPVIENAAVKIAFNISEPRNLDYVSRIFSGIYHVERMNAIRNALRNIKSLSYLLSISGLNDVLIVSEEDVVKYLFENVSGD